ncbi:hypothetical protein CI610_03453 [invertebrate metagenome]|uniref:Uncharacterized protein n=1 Tax=invertebrate metagenome TaxID=1711999 RepID=A0A2H9T321_9ZZZZ
MAPRSTGRQRGGDLELLKYLKEQGADVNAGTTGSGTPIRAAAESGRFRVVKYLLNNGGKESDIRDLYFSGLGCSKGLYECLRF